MIKLNGEEIKLNHFPDGTLLLKEDVSYLKENSYIPRIEWKFENNEEMVALYFLTKHLKNCGYENINLSLPYIPNARQDRVKNKEDVFTLKYFAEFINSLGFKKVQVLDPHSSVSAALIDHMEVVMPFMGIYNALENIKTELQLEGKNEGRLMYFYPDEGAMKRYSEFLNNCPELEPRPYAFGIKNRDWKTGEIKSLDVSGETDMIKDSNVLIIDDICSKGGTFYYSAKKLKELGAKNIYLFVSHCENTIAQGELLKTDLVKRIYTTSSILTIEDDKIKVVGKR